jgi:uncharacterized protein
MRITIRVKPGSARTGVGGEHDGALVVRVTARAVDGKATEAAMAAVADSFGVRRSAVRLVSGALSRIKVVDIDAGDPHLLAALLAAPGHLRPSIKSANLKPRRLFMTRVASCQGCRGLALALAGFRRARRRAPQPPSGRRSPGCLRSDRPAP